MWGLAFKANTDDIREAPSLSVIDALTAAGARVRAYDPVAMANARAVINGNNRVELAVSAEAALDGADVLAVITEWLEFRSPDFDQLGAKTQSQGNFRRPQFVRSRDGARCGSSILRHRSRNMSKRATTLVTGAAGFIGSFVAQQLLERGDTVVGWTT